jgi:hypothetical protein
MSDEDIQRQLDHLEHAVDEVDRKVDKLDRDISRYRGLVGGVLLAISSVGIFLKLVWEAIKEHVTWQ